MKTVRRPCRPKWVIIDGLHDRRLCLNFLSKVVVALASCYVYKYKYVCVCIGNLTKMCLFAIVLATFRFNKHITQRTLSRSQAIEQCLYAVWQYRLWSFQGSDTKLERFLVKYYRKSDKIIYSHAMLKVRENIIICNAKSSRKHNHIYYTNDDEHLYKAHIRFKTQ